MVSISTAALTPWESPSAIDGAASQLKSAASSFASHVEQADGTWSTLPGAYQGPSEQTLFSAVNPAVINADFIRNAGNQAHEALAEFASELRTLREQRNALMSRVGSFENDHGDSSTKDLDPFELQQQRSLQREAQMLQLRYDELVTTCVGSLDGIRAGADGTTDSGLTNGVGNAMKPLPLIGGGLAGLEAPSTTHRYTTTRTVTQTPGGTPNWHTYNPQYTMSHTGWSWYGMPLNNMSTDHLVTAARNDHVPGETPGQRLRTGFWPGFTNNLADSVPGVADYRAWRDGSFVRNGATYSQGPSLTSMGPDGSTTTSSTTTQTRTSGLDLRHGLSRGLTHAGTAGTVLTAGMEFSSQRAENRQKLAQQNPEMSAEEINAEANHDAASNTAGRTLATVGASAAAGAAAGSVVPVAGNAVGLVVGVGAGLAMEWDVLPDVDGDGQKDSLADAAGHGAEWIWDETRDGLSGAAESVSESKLNPLNWF